MSCTQGAQTRKHRTDEKVYRAAVDLMRTAGVGAVTVEAVATRSGVAKTTIYRRHSDRVALLQAALEHFLPQPQDVSGLEPRPALTALVDALSRTVEQYVGTWLVSTLAEGDDPAAEVLRQYVIAPRIDQIIALLQTWRDAGSIRTDIDVDLAAASIIGTSAATYARCGTFGDGWAERLVAHLWPLLEPPPPTSSYSP